MIEILSFLLFVVTFILIVIRIAQELSGQADANSFVGIVLSIVIAYILSDFSSGMIHFLCDNFGSCSTYWFGPNLIKPFREHHKDPESILNDDFLVTEPKNLPNLGFELAAFSL